MKIKSLSVSLASIFICSLLNAAAPKAIAAAAKVTAAISASYAKNYKLAQDLHPGAGPEVIRGAYRAAGQALRLNDPKLHVSKPYRSLVVELIKEYAQKRNTL